MRAKMHFVVQGMAGTSRAPVSLAVLIKRFMILVRMKSRARHLGRLFDSRHRVAFRCQLPANVIADRAGAPPKY